MIIYHNGDPNATAQMRYYKHKYKSTINNPQNPKEIEQILKYIVGYLKTNYRTPIQKTLRY
jgi:hypothetical protein